MKLTPSGIVLLATVFLCLAAPVRAQGDGDKDPGRVAFLAGDYMAALDLWTPLAEAGDLAAQFHIGLLHDEGLGVQADADEARRWWRRAAQRGLTEAHHQLALLELELASARGGGGSAPAALAHLHAAAAAGHLKARYTLGRVYKLGFGVEPNQASAVRHIRIAAEHGLARAQFNMGQRHREGAGVTKDAAMAAEWFRRAALGGHPGAQDRYARLLKEGKQINPDPTQAMTMAVLAMRAGYEDAYDLAETLKKSLSVSQLDHAFTDVNAFEPAIIQGAVKP